VKYITWLLHLIQLGSGVPELEPAAASPTSLRAQLAGVAHRGVVLVDSFFTHHPADIIHLRCYQNITSIFVADS